MFNKISKRRLSPLVMVALVFLATITLRTGQVIYTNAGQTTPMLPRASGDVDEVPDAHGPVLGALEGMEYGESSINLGPGDVLLVFTDGVTEAMDKEGSLYSDARLLQTMQDICEISADSILKTVCRSVDDFALGAEQADDITMITLQYTG